MPQNIGFIGLGNIGNPIAQRILQAKRILQNGSDLYINDIKHSLGENLVEAGAVWCETIGELTSSCGVILLSLPGPEEVSSVMGEVLENAKPQTIVVDLTTNSLGAVREMQAKSLKNEVIYLDAPVSGGAHGARDGTLTVLVSGDTEAFEKTKGVMEAFGSNIVYLGADVGASTIIKVVNNQIFLSTQVLYAEGLVLAAKAGMDMREVHEILKTCSSAPFIVFGELFLQRDFDASIFSTALANKDVSMALKSAEELGVKMPTTQAAQSLLGRGADSDLAQKSFASIIQLLEADAGIAET